MAPATLTINSRNYGAWSLRGWLLCRMAGLEFVEEVLPAGDPAARAELLLLSPSFLVPRLDHEGVSVWDVLAIAEYLQERFPRAGLLPDEPVARAHCRSISGEVVPGIWTSVNRSAAGKISQNTSRAFSPPRMPVSQS